jgi:hypothetical protein
MDLTPSWLPTGVGYAYHIGSHIGGGDANAEAGTDITDNLPELLENRKPIEFLPFVLTTMLYSTFRTTRS